jgi:hypothetical protein
MRPVIAEILRTGVRHVPLLLRVERVAAQTVKEAAGEKGGRRRRSNRVSRLYLTDDEFVVQALLLPELELEVKQGDQLQIHKYTVHKAARKGQAGHIVFFGVEDCDNLTRLRPDNEAAEQAEGGFIRERTSFSTFTSAQPSTRKRTAYDVSSEGLDTALPPPSKQVRLDQSPDISSDDNMSAPRATQESEDDFEAFTPNAHMTQHRRQALRELDSNRSSYFSPGSLNKPRSSSPSTPARKPPQSTAVQQPLSKPASADQPQQPTKLRPSSLSPKPSALPVSPFAITPLSTLPSLEPSTPTTILGIVTWTSPKLLRPSPAFPPKRHVKIHDISIGQLFSGVSLAVYIDAAGFKPRRGTIALLQDVVVQRCGSGIGEVNECFMLNAYANLPGKLAEKQKGLREDGGGTAGSGSEGKWFIDDEDQLLALGLEAEVDELRTWWEEREAKRAGTAARSTQAPRN